MRKDYLKPEATAVEISTGEGFLLEQSNPGNSGQDMNPPTYPNPFA